ncbi:cytochrome [Novosphingobium fuchskuhlense]|uniref:Cytochrome n=1 Tax=Novosphingobium fuchskuhlense TaxID=1117702 RepID=A0A124JVZ5_9SPHN|nr:cytochrome P450 [Novosphingobium fuchskuhlense]KUR72799.1 cytochrome [Novosphingobium fuchskuhlense]
MSDGLRFDLTDPQLKRDPYPIFKALRDADPMHFSPLGFWIATRYEDVRAILMDRTNFGQGDFLSNIRLFYGPDFDVLSHSAYRWLSEIFLYQDPPRHTRVRGLVTQALTARRVMEMRPRVQAVADRLLDAVMDQRRMEVIHAFAYRFPTLVMCDMLGLSPEEASDEVLVALNQAIADSFVVFEMRAFSDAELGLANRQMDFLLDFFGSVIADRRRAPRDDLATALCNARDETGPLSDHEIATVAIGLFGAGFETTAHMIGNGLLSLAKFPDQWAKLVADPDLAEAATEEILRYESSLVGTNRTAFRDTEVGGQLIRAGERVLTLVAAANRDPAVFEEPDRFDVTRKGPKHLSFGGGIHFCVGAELARLEGEIALKSLVTRFPQLQIDAASAQWRREGFMFRGLTKLDVSW